MGEYAALWLAAGAMFLLGLLIVVSRTLRRGRCTAQTRATIVEVLEDWDSDSDGHKTREYRPVFEYFVDGKQFREEGDMAASRRNAYRVGAVYTVLYNPDKPAEFIVPGKSGGRGAGVFLIVLSLAIVAVLLVFGR